MAKDCKIVSSRQAQCSNVVNKCSIEQWLGIPGNLIPRTPVQIPGLVRVLIWTILSLLYVYPWMLHYLPHSTGSSSPSTAESRPTNTSTTGEHNLTFPRAHPCRTESARCGWAEAAHVYTIRPTAFVNVIAGCTLRHAFSYVDHNET